MYMVRVDKKTEDFNLIRRISDLPLAEVLLIHSGFTREKIRIGKVYLFITAFCKLINNEIPRYFKPLWLKTPYSHV